MFKYVTNIVLAVLLLSSTAGFFISGHHCDFALAKADTRVERNSCCMVPGLRDDQTTPFNVHVHGFHHHDLSGCAEHEGQGCSCHSDREYFAPAEVLVINKPFSFDFSGAGSVVAYIDNPGAGWNRIQSNILPYYFSFLKLPVNVQAAYGVFTC